MKKLIFILALLFPLLAAAQTNVLYGYVGNVALGGTISRIPVTLTYIGLPPGVSNIQITVAPAGTSSATNGYYAFTNVVYGKYTLSIGNGANTTARNLYVYTNTLGLVPIGSLIPPPSTIPASQATNYYTIAQVNALVSGLGGGAGLYSGNGTPSNIVSALKGSIYTDTNSKSLYVNLDGTITNWYWLIQGH